MIICLLIKICGDWLAVNSLGLPGVARRLVTFFVLPKKVTKKSRPQSAIPAGSSVLLGWSGGCGNQSSPTTPGQPVLLGGGTGEVKAQRVRRVVSSHLHFSDVFEGMK